MKMVDLKELENKLTIFRDTSDLIKQEICLYRKKISSVMLDISSVGYNDTSLKFDELYTIQSALALVYYKYDFPIEDVLEEFVCDFDRDE